MGTGVGQSLKTKTGVTEVVGGAPPLLPEVGVPRCVTWADWRARESGLSQPGHVSMSPGAIIGWTDDRPGTCLGGRVVEGEDG